MSIYPISDLKYHSEFQESRVQNLSCENDLYQSTRMRLLFVSAPFRGSTRTLNRFQRVFGHHEYGHVFVSHSWIIGMNQLQYSLSVRHMMVSWSIAGLCGCQTKTQLGGLSPLSKKIWRLLRRTTLDYSKRMYGLSKQHHMARRLTRRPV